LTCALAIIRFLMSMACNDAAAMDAQRRHPALGGVDRARPCAPAVPPRAASAGATATHRPPARESNGWPARSPASSRMPVPALPQSSGAAVRAQAVAGRPRGPRARPGSGHVDAHPELLQKMAAVARASSPSRKPSMRDTPSAIAASISARCDTDLSPGTSISPRNAVPREACQSCCC
jgi:hypothetical protein